MALTTTAFKPLPSSGVVLPELVPASQFAVECDFNASVFKNAYLPYYRFSAVVFLQVKDKAGTLKYTITQTEYFDLVINSLSHTYAWTWLPALETLTATRADGSPMTTGEGISGNVTLGARKGLVVPPSGSGGLDVAFAFLTGTIPFLFFVYTPLLTGALAQGDTITPTVLMQPSGFNVSHRSLKLATVGGRLPVLHDRQGALRTLVAQDDGRLYLSHTYGGPGTVRWRDSIPGTGASLWKDRTGRMFAVSLAQNDGNDGWLLWQSDLEGMDWQPVEVGGKQVAIWTNGFSGVDTKPRRQGGFASIAQLETELYFALSPDNRMRQSIRHVGPHQDRPCTLSIGSTADGRERYIITDGYKLQYESSDGIKFDLVEV